jgi:hypothetical protein
MHHQGKNIGKTAALPYEDMLLPGMDESEDVEEDDVDLEGAERGWLRRRKRGKAVDYGVQNEEGEELWLDDDEDDGESSCECIVGAVHMDLTET